jgi:hypothetical protein
MLHKKALLAIFLFYLFLNVWKKKTFLKVGFSKMQKRSVLFGHVCHLNISLKVRLHKRCGSGVFAERCDFNRNLDIFSNHHRWRQKQHLMFRRLCKHHFTRSMVQILKLFAPNRQ